MSNFKLNNIEMHCADNFLHIEVGGFMNSIRINHLKDSFIRFLDTISPFVKEYHSTFSDIDVSVHLGDYSNDYMIELYFDTSGARTILFFPPDQFKEFVEWYKVYS